MRKLLLSLTSLLILPVAHATTFDAVSDFSIASNPNGVWRYGYGSSTNFKLFDTSGTSGGTMVWTSSTAGAPPVIFFNAAGFTGSTNSVPGTEIGVHPGPNAGLDSILSFTAPTTGLYNLSSSFTRRDNTASGNGVNVGVYLDGLLLTGSSDYLSTNSGHVPFVYSNSALSLVAGDVLLFDVSNNGEYSFDTTGITARLTNTPATSVTPEPSSLILLGSGMLSLVAAGRRRFLKA